MANYGCASRTNYFRVTDEEKYQELFSGLCAEDTIQDFTVVDENGSLLHGVGCYGSPFCEDPNGEAEDGFDGFVDVLRKILPEDEAFIYLESGNEKLRYLIGIYITATRDEVRSGDIAELAQEAAKEMLGDEFTTRVYY